MAQYPPYSTHTIPTPYSPIHHPPGTPPVPTLPATVLSAAVSAQPGSVQRAVGLGTGKVNK